MIPVTQQIFADPARNDGHDSNGTPGDCLRAAVASVFEYELHEVPHFAASANGWWERLVEFSRTATSGELHYQAYEPQFPLYTEEPAHLQRFAILCGPSPRGDFLHAVVCDALTGEIAHDPHPSRAGLAGPPVDVLALSPRPADAEGSDER